MRSVSPVNSPLALEFHGKRLELAESILLPKALSGEQWAIRNILLIVSDAISEGVMPPPTIADFLAKGLMGIADKTSLLTPFGLKRKRGERDLTAIRARAFSRAYRVECFRHDGSTLDEAIGTVSSKDKAPEDTVKRDWKKNHLEAKRQIKLSMEHLGKVIRIK